MIPPGRFAYEVIDKRHPDQWWVLTEPGGVQLGDVCQIDDERGWMARPNGDDAFTPDFASRRAAAVWLWERAVDMLGHDALRSRPMSKQQSDDTKPSPFLDLTKRAGLTVSMASRIVGVDLRTGRRWAAGKGTGANAPHAALAVLEPLAQENAEALEQEARGHVHPRPLRNKAIEAAIAREATYRARRVEKGLHPSPRGTGPQRMLKEAERALRRTREAEAAAGVLGDTPEIRARRIIEAQRAAQRAAARARRTSTNPQKG